MLHEVNWYTIAMTLRNFLRNYKKSDGSILFPSLVDRDDLIIRVGAGNTGEYPAIWILFGSEESLALTFNILPKDIANPTPYPISRLAQTFAYMTAAQRKATFSVGKDADNDSFSLKYRLYKSLLDELESKITADSFKDGNSAKRRKFPSTMAMYRN